MTRGARRWDVRGAGPDAPMCPVDQVEQRDGRRSACLVARFVAAAARSRRTCLLATAANRYVSIGSDGVKAAARPEEQYAARKDGYSSQDVTVGGADGKALLFVPRAVKRGLGR